MSKRLRARRQAGSRKGPRLYDDWAAWDWFALCYGVAGGLALLGWILVGASAVVLWLDAIIR